MKFFKKQEVPHRKKYAINYLKYSVTSDMVGFFPPCLLSKDTKIWVCFLGSRCRSNCTDTNHHGQERHQMNYSCMDFGSAALTHSAGQESRRASASEGDLGEGGRFHERSAAKSEISGLITPSV
jgi:hypothetical protein